MGKQLGKIHVIVGPTCSGKSLLKKIFVRAGCQGIITYTTRPPRSRESNGWDYHFITNDEFARKIRDNFFYEYRQYRATDGVWWYGTPYSAFRRSGDVVVILDPIGMRKVKASFGDRVIVHSLDAPDNILLGRARRRGDDAAEAVRRLRSDRQSIEANMMMGW